MALVKRTTKVEKVVEVEETDLFVVLENDELFFLVDKQFVDDAEARGADLAQHLEKAAVVIIDKKTKKVAKSRFF